MNTILKVNENLEIGLKPSNTNIGVDYIKINTNRYYNDCENMHNTINDLLKGCLKINAREILNLDDLKINRVDIEFFLSWILFFVEDLNNIDINKAYDVIFNELFNNYIDKLMQYVSYDFSKIFDGKLNITYGNHDIYYNLESMNFNDCIPLLGSDWNIFKSILKVIAYLSDIFNSDKHNYKMLDEFCNIKRFLKNKKHVKVNNVKIDSTINKVLQSCNDYIVNQLQHNKNVLNIKYATELKIFKGL